MASKNKEAAAGRHGFASVLDVTREGEGVEQQQARQAGACRLSERPGSGCMSPKLNKRLMSRYSVPPSPFTAPLPLLLQNQAAA
jgi:hypothetical protein